MALSRLTTGTLGAEGNPASTITLTWPTSGITSSSLAILVVNLYENGNDTNANNPGTGWVLQTTSTGDVITGSGTTQTKSFVFTKACDGTESGSLVISHTAGTTIYWGAMLDVYNGSNDLTFASISTVNTGNGTDAVAPSVSGTDGQGLICVYALSGDPGTTNSGPSGMTQGSDNPDATSAGCPTRNYYVDLSSTGATGTKTWDFTNTRDYAAYSILVDGASNASSGGTLKIAAIAQTLNVIFG